MDGIDAVLVEFDEHNFKLIDQYSHTIPTELRTQIFKLAHNDNVDLAVLGASDAELGKEFASAACTLLDRNKLDKAQVTAIGSHGQTIWHSPDSAYKFSLQIGNPNQIAYHTGITTVADFRNRNMIAGGEGAPFAPAFHRAVFSNHNENRAVLNLGGIANITFLPADTQQPCIGFDSGPASVLMDHWSNRHINRPYDEDGAWAAGGTCIPALLEQLMADPYLQRKPPKSTGREYYHMAWLEQRLQGFSDLAARDVQTTLCEFTVQSVKMSLQQHVPEVQTMIVCGGGAHNRFLMQRLQQALPDVKVDSSGQFGLHPDWVEAVAFAWYARQTLRGEAVALMDITGARHNVLLGAIYPV